MNKFFIDFKAAKIPADTFSSQGTVTISQKLQNLNTAILEGNMNISKFFGLKNNQ